MSKDTRLVRIESDEPLGQFLENSIEEFIGGDSANVRVTEIDPNTVSEEVR